MFFFFLFLLFRLRFFFSVFCSASLPEPASLFLTRYSSCGVAFLSFQMLLARVLETLSSLVVVDLCLDWRETVRFAAVTLYDLR